MHRRLPAVGQGKKMLALISTGITSRGESIQLLGVGATEFLARRAAFARVRYPLNMYEEELDGGQLVAVEEGLADVLLTGDTTCVGWAHASLYLDAAGVLCARDHVPNLQLLAEQAAARRAVSDVLLTFE